MRLAKYLAHSGVASRRRSEELVAAGRVRVVDPLLTDEVERAVLDLAPPDPGV